MADRCLGVGALLDLGPVSLSLDRSAMIWPRRTKSSSSLVSAAHCCLIGLDQDHCSGEALISEAVVGNWDAGRDLPYCSRHSQDSLA